MSGEREGEGERLAGFIADGLHDSGVLGATDIQRATAIAAEEIAVSKAMGAYWCSWCCLKPEAAAGVQANDEAISFAADGVGRLCLACGRRGAWREPHCDAPKCDQRCRHRTYVEPSFRYRALSVPDSEAEWRLG